jgi:hypothetical protein
MATLLKPDYTASVNFTLTALNSLANDFTNMLAGWQTDIVDNTSELAIDVGITGFIKTAAAGLTANRPIEIWAYGSLDDAGTYPDVLTGAGQATKTLTSTEIKLSGALARLGTITTNATASQVYPFSYSLVNDGLRYMPRKWGLFIVQGTGAALAASGHQITRTPYRWTNV